MVGTLKDEELARTALEIDPDRSNVILIIGTKGSGKSEAARMIFDAWPYDRVVVDVTGDARPEDPEALVLTVPFPSQLPEGEDGARVTAWARIDPRSATYRATKPGESGDQDAALALGLYPRRRKVLVWVDEFAELATASAIEPNTKLGLISSRHYSLSLLLPAPRPARIPVLSIAQADLILIFETPRRDDRKILADNMGFPFNLFEKAYAANRLRGSHALLLWDKRQRRLFDLPPLPLAQSHGPRA
jgi:hypothetical protein